MDVLKPPMPMSFITSNVAENWRGFERQFRVYYAAGGELQLKSKATQVGILQHTAGAEAQDVHETFDFDVHEDKDDYELVLTQSFVPILRHAKTSCLNDIRFGVVTKARANQSTSG